MHTNSHPITLDRFPEAMNLLIARLDKIERLLAERQPTSNTSKPISTRELCEHLGVTEPTIIRWRKKGLIPFFQIGSAVRFDLPKVIAALEKRGNK